MKPHVISLAGGGTLLFFQEWLKAADRKSLWDHLVDQPWSHQTIRVMGREVLQPRLTAAWSDPGVSYRYSGLTVTPRPWTEEIRGLRKQLEHGLAYSFSYALGNYYRNGRDSIGFHADDEPELGSHPVIASLSLGGTRRMTFKHKNDREAAALTLDLTDGSLLVMSGTTQEHWLHGIPKTAKPVEPRINLTFRKIVDPRS